MRENLTYGSRWQGMETRTRHGQLRHSQRKRGANGLPSLNPRRHPLTLLADRLIEYFIVADLIFVSYQFLFGTLFHPTAVDTRHVRRAGPTAHICQDTVGSP
jgi:hypothetical protein